MHALVPAPAGYTDPALLVLRDDHDIVLLDPAGDASTLDEDQLVDVADTLRPPTGASLAG